MRTLHLGPAQNLRVRPVVLTWQACRPSTAPARCLPADAGCSVWHPQPLAPEHEPAFCPVEFTHLWPPSMPEGVSIRQDGRLEAGQPSALSTTHPCAPHPPPPPPPHSRCWPRRSTAPPPTCGPGACPLSAGASQLWPTSPTGAGGAPCFAPATAAGRPSVRVVSSSTLMWRGKGSGSAGSGTSHALLGREAGRWLCLGLPAALRPAQMAAPGPGLCRGRPSTSGVHRPCKGRPHVVPLVSAAWNG